MERLLMSRVSKHNITNIRIFFLSMLGYIGDTQSDLVQNNDKHVESRIYTVSQKNVTLFTRT